MLVVRLSAALALITSSTACGGVADKIRVAHEVASGMAPGHTYRTFSSANEAMAPTIPPHGAIVLVDTSAYAVRGPSRGDIIVFAPPIESKNAFIKRVIGLPGDRVAIHHGRIEVNGRPARPVVGIPKYEFVVANDKIAVDGNPLDGSADVPPRAKWSTPDRLPAGCYVVLGDNPNNSLDSHIFGCAELHGRFSAGVRRGEPTKLEGKVVKIIPTS